MVSETSTASNIALLPHEFHAYGPSLSPVASKVQHSHALGWQPAAGRQRRTIAPACLPSLYKIPENGILGWGAGGGL